MLTDKQFVDWEADVFGYGYGTGESYTIPALTEILRATNADGNYDYSVLEAKLESRTVAWLLIGILCHAKIFEYGTSPRYGRLTNAGNLLREYVANHSTEELIQKVNDRPEDYVYCLREYCNCLPRHRNPSECNPLF